MLGIPSNRIPLIVTILIQQNLDHTSPGQFAAQKYFQLEVDLLQHLYCPLALITE